MADERIRLLLDFGVAAQEAERIIVSMDKLKVLTRGAADTYEVLDTVIAKSVGIVGNYEVLERQVTQTTRQEVTALQSLGIELEKQAGLYAVVTAEMNAVGGTMTRAMGRGGAGGMGVMGVSYAFQDFTAVLTGGGGFARALSSVQNNIPILVTALGAGAGLAGTVSIVAVAAGVLISSWDSLVDAWKGGDTAKQAEEMKKLARATDDVREAAEKLAKTLPPDQRQGSKELGRAVEAFGGEAVLKELSEALRARGGSFGPGADKEMALRLFQNLQQGNRQAQTLLGDLDVRGPIGQVLRGGKTPQEDLETRRDAASVFEASQKAFAAKRKQEQEKDARDEQEGARKADRETARLQEGIQKRAKREKAQAARAAGQFLPRGRFDMGKFAKAGGFRGQRERQQAQQTIFERTGQVVSPQMAAEAVKRGQQELERAQVEGINAILMDGQRRQRELWQATIRQLSRMQQDPGPSGLQR